MSDLTPWLERTPARLFVGRSGTSYSTETQLSLRVDHAAAVDAVRAEIDSAFLDGLGLPEVHTQARDKSEYLLRPDLGRLLAPESVEFLGQTGTKGADLQICVGDGLSARAVLAQVPALLPLLTSLALERGWTLGKPFFVRYCRVGVMNMIGAVLDPAVVVLLIGERPGLATAESLSAYFAYRPRPGHTDAQRNLISNIHARGVAIDEAADRIINLAEQMLTRQISGVSVKEALRPRLA